MEPTFDEDGRIDAQTAEHIRTHVPEEVYDWIGYCLEAFNRPYAYIRRYGDFVSVTTGGWGNNEHVIATMRENEVMWAYTWESSNRNGEHVFRVCNRNQSA